MADIDHNKSQAAALTVALVVVVAVLGGMFLYYNSPMSDTQVSNSPVTTPGNAPSTTGTATRQ
jgi:hypothetical protein